MLYYNKQTDTIIPSSNPLLKYIKLSPNNIHINYIKSIRKLSQNEVTSLLSSILQNHTTHRIITIDSIQYNLYILRKRAYLQMSPGSYYMLMYNSKNYYDITNSPDEMYK